VFLAFINRGNVLDLAVGVIIAGAFGKIVTALTDDFIMPFVSLLTRGMDFSSKVWVFGPVPATYKGSLTNLADLKKAGVAAIGYGDFVSVVINFLIMAFVVFMLVKTANKLMKRPPEAAVPENIILLREIRDSLKK
jgi:large conductance mechanosensitive channel